MLAKAVNERDEAAEAELAQCRRERDEAWALVVAAFRKWDEYGGPHAAAEACGSKSGACLCGLQDLEDLAMRVLTTTPARPEATSLKSNPPRYDDVYRAGVEAMDEAEAKCATCGGLGEYMHHLHERPVPCPSCTGREAKP